MPALSADHPRPLMTHRQPAALGCPPSAFIRLFFCALDLVLVAGDPDLGLKPPACTTPQRVSNRGLGSAQALVVKCTVCNSPFQYVSFRAVCAIRPFAVVTFHEFC